MANNNSTTIECDVVLIGAGIMSATLSVFLKELQPDWKIEIFERLDRVAGESSDAWNNAGTGHSGLCELNYAPEMEDGSIDISKAIKVIEQFEVSKQFWSFLVQQGFFGSPHQFINSIPHMSLVWGDENVRYLKKRYEAMVAHHLFKAMEYSENPEQLKQWMPIIMEGRALDQKIAATHIEIGTDVNFGELTRSFFNHLKGQHDVDVNLSHEVYHFDKDESGGWEVRVKDLDTGKHKVAKAKFVCRWRCIAIA